MNKLLLFVLTFITYFSFSQTGKITGKIIDSKTGETLPGATAVIEGTTKGASADFDGNFSLNNVPAGKVNLIFSYISYDSKKFTDVVVKENDVTNINVQLEPSSSTTFSEVVVVVEMIKENNAALTLMQKNNISVSDGVSAETIKKTPDRTTADVIKRVSGVTIVNDKFVVIRGLNDRYNASYLNGAPLPSTEADRKAFAFDIFPANMLDNILINKTATPDMPGDFAGGIVQVNTKSIPDKNFISTNFGMGYNPFATGKQQLTYQGGKYDWLGADDGSRNLPSAIPDNPSTWISNKNQLAMAKNFNNDWALKSQKFSPNYTGQLAAGYNIKLKDRDFLGIIFSLGYNKTNNYYERYRTNYQTSKNNNEVLLEDYYNNKIYQTNVMSGALLNLTCKITENHSISSKNMLSYSSEDKVVQAFGTAAPLDSNRLVDRNTARLFMSNRVASTQLNGDHYLPKLKLKINWIGGYSNVYRTIPNARYTSYSKFTHIMDPGSPNPLDTVYQANIGNATSGPSYAGYRYFSRLNEDIRSFRLDLSRSFKISESLKLDAKIGTFFQNRSRTFEIRQLGYAIGSYSTFDFNLLSSAEDTIFAPQHLGTPSGFKLLEITKVSDKYWAGSNLFANYAMVDLKYKTWFRFIAGVRNERYNQKLNSMLRFGDTIRIDTTVMDWLPSANVIINLTEKQALRLVYAKTVNRPEFRELAPSNWYEPDTRFIYYGNDSLVRTTIQNYDLRYEFYPGMGQVFSVSGFYKSFYKPIEMVMDKAVSDQITWANAKSATLYGCEMEFRVNIGNIFKLDSIRFLNNLSVFANAAFIKSEVVLPDYLFSASSKRPMQGQSPYIVNGGISYNDPKYNFGVNLMVNRVGPRIWIAGNAYDPDKWETGRTVVDISASKTFLKNKLEIRFLIKDLFHQNAYVYQNADKNYRYNSKVDYTFFKTQYRTVYSMQIGYKF
jgi:TonB-dependent receptor